MHCFVGVVCQQKHLSLKHKTFYFLHCNETIEFVMWFVRFQKQKKRPFFYSQRDTTNFLGKTVYIIMKHEHK